MTKTSLSSSVENEIELSSSITEIQGVAFSHELLPLVQSQQDQEYALRNKVEDNKKCITLKAISAATSITKRAQNRAFTITGLSMVVGLLGALTGYPAVGFAGVAGAVSLAFLGSSDNVKKYLNKLHGVEDLEL